MVLASSSLSSSVCVCVCVRVSVPSSIANRPISRPSGEGKGGSLHDHLLAGKQRVADELASPQSNGSVGHFGGEW